MNGNRDISKGHTALAPIVALLLALADHALNASRRALPVRAYLLWLLRRAEAATYDQLAAVGALELVPKSRRGRLGMIFGGVSVGAAQHLAANLTAMARALEKWEARMLKREERNRAREDGCNELPDYLTALQGRERDLSGGWLNQALSPAKFRWSEACSLLVTGRPTSPAWPDTS